MSIHLSVQKATKEIVLNAHQLDIKKVEIVGNATSTLIASLLPRDSLSLGCESTSVNIDEKAHRASFTFPESIPLGETELRIGYHGTINNIMAGFSRSKYKSTAPPSPSTPKEGDSSLMFSTQFEACDARRAFPCFDEPNLKATFDFEMEIPEGLTVLSNMPEKDTRPGKYGRKFVAFERTPVMSTYLLAWAFGDFEYVEAFTQRKYNGKQLPVRVYTTRGLKEQGRWALEHAHQIVDYFGDLFQLDFPLPKMDLLAVHEFAQGAMENWGLVTYRVTALLFNESNSDARYRKRIAYVVAHELAHQWFGNLVTMDWWNELWLNESFATWVGYLATDHLHPEWDEWAQFTFEATQAAFNIDSLRSSHAVAVPVKAAQDVEQIFDAISYYKGSSLIRMLSSYLGVEAFLGGVAKYLKAHAYGNATTNDLWSALSEASGKDVQTFMDPWIEKIGFPVLTVAEEPGQISVRQSRFLVTGDVKPEDDETLWWVPLGLKSGPRASEVDTSALAKKEDTLRNIDESFYKLNWNATGFFRTNYPPDRLTKLGAARDKLSAPGRIRLVADAAALATAGEGTTAGLLLLCAEFKQETNFLWVQRISVSKQLLTHLGSGRKFLAASALSAQSFRPTSRRPQVLRSSCCISLALP